MARRSDTCPVCGMRAKAELSSVAHQKMYFHFCSDRCRKTFIAHPSLYSSAKAGKERSEILKRQGELQTIMETAHVGLEDDGIVAVLPVINFTKFAATATSL